MKQIKIKIELKKSVKNIYNKTKYLAKLENNNVDDYDNKLLKIRIISDDALPLEKRLAVFNVAIIIWSVFNDENKLYPQVFLKKWLLKLA